MSLVKSTGARLTILAAAAAVWSSCGLPGGDLCTSFAGYGATYEYSTDCMGSTVTGRFTLDLPSNATGLPDTRPLSEQARAGGLNADFTAQFTTKDSDLCTNPREKGQDPTAVLRGLIVSVYPVPVDGNRTGVAPFNCGGISPYDGTVPVNLTCSRSTCPTGGGVCDVQRCTLTLHHL